MCLLKEKCFPLGHRLPSLQQSKECINASFILTAEDTLGQFVNANRRDPSQFILLQSDKRDDLLKNLADIMTLANLAFSPTLPRFKMTFYKYDKVVIVRPPIRKLEA